MTELKCVKITYRNNDSYFLEQASTYRFKYKTKLKNIVDYYYYYYYYYYYSYYYYYYY